MITLTVPSFFNCRADHRDLHSFPTRRSSDLMLVEPDPDMIPLIVQAMWLVTVIASEPVNVPPLKFNVGTNDAKRPRLYSIQAFIAYTLSCLNKGPVKFTVPPSTSVAPVTSFV